VELLEKVDPVAFKIASGEVTNPPLVEAVARTGKPVFVSTGMSGLEEIAAAVGILRGLGARFVLMQCTSVYPCPPERVNLRAIRTLAEHFRCQVGLSDHTPTIHTAIAAVALGAVCIEKHFTLSRRLYGPDHHASLEPADLAELVRGVRQVEAAMGDGEKVHDTSLDPVRATFEKSIVTRVAIPGGAVIEHSMLTTKRPGSGIPARRLSDVVGRRALRAIPPNELVDEADLG
jgi:sialic acid synthase SpsE